jgi:uncharacterized protein YbjT (DUF2867 family)
MAERILVVGARGLVGGGVVAALGRRGEAVRAATRDVATAARWGRGVEITAFDFERPETFDPALEGVGRVFLLARPGDEASDVAAAPFIDAMRRHGVRHVVNLTALGAEVRPDFALRKLELYLEGSGLAFTHLRPNWFMQVLSSGALGAALRLRGELRLPAAGAAVSFVDARDVSAAAAVALCEPGHEGRAYALTGARAIGHDEAVGIIARATGRDLRYVAIDEDEARALLGAAEFGPAWVERLIGFYRLVRAGACAVVSGDLERLLGRAPASFEGFVAEHVGCWAEPGP